MSASILSSWTPCTDLLLPQEFSPFRFKINHDVCLAGKSVGLQICWQVLESQLFQYAVGFILIFNFLINVAEAELTNIPDVDTGVFEALDTLDITLTVFYCLELAINMFVHWWRDFFFNGWSVFDGLCVILSVVGNLLSAGGGGGGGLTVIRSIRIFKIVRIFSRSS